MTAHQTHVEHNALFQKAIALGKSHRVEEAERLYRRILDASPHHLGATLNCANLLIKRNNLLDAIPLYESLSRTHPEHTGFMETLGELYSAVNAHEKSIQCYKQLIKKPNPKLKHFHIISNLFFKMSEIEDATSYLFWALSLDSENYISLTSLGNAFIMLGQPSEALTFFKKAHELYPDKTESATLLGNTLYKTGQYKQALEIYTKILRAHKHTAQMLELCGKCALNMNQLGEAARFFTQALNLSPKSSTANYHLGNTLAAQGNHVSALKQFEKSISLNKDLAEAKFNAGLCNLSLGNLKKGFELYSWRWSVPQYQKDMLRLPYPLWDGSTDTHLRLLIWDEQGIGDTIFFSQALKQLNLQILDTKVLCEPRMIPVLKRSFPKIEFYPRPTTASPNMFSANDFDAQIPIGDLNYYLMDFNESNQVRQGRRYLESDQSALSQFKSFYKQKICIGINWRTLGKQTEQRSIPLQIWSELFKSFPQVTWVNIQYGDDNHEFSELMHNLNASHIYDPSVNPLKDMDMFYAQIDALDAIVSIDNSTAHVAGSLGKPCFLMLPKVHDWRWPLTGGYCRWYENMTVFRKDGADWNNTLDKVRDTLETFCLEKNPSKSQFNVH